MKRPGDFFQKGIDYLSAALLGTVIILVVFFSNVPRYISKSFLLPNGTLVLIAVGGWLLFVGACRFISEKSTCACLPTKRAGKNNTWWTGQ